MSVGQVVGGGLLGAAAPEQDWLARLVLDAAGMDTAGARLLDADVEAVPYDLFALLTAGRYRVRATAEGRDGRARGDFFVKLLQSWRETPVVEVVPDFLAPGVDAALPWRCEPMVYASDLRARLPEGMAMPRLHAWVETGQSSGALWLEYVDHAPAGWDLSAVARAAGLFGRLAGRPSIAELAWVGDPGQGRTLRGYVDVRVRPQLVPALTGSQVWEHPAVAGSVDPSLREDLVEVAGRLDAILEELEAMPHSASHGDASVRNLLRRRGDMDELVVVDFGFWSCTPIGFDLGQLLFGEVQTGDRPAEDIPALERAILPAFIDGLRQEGDRTPTAVVRRAHGLQLLLFGVLPCLPLDELAADPSDALAPVVRQRADMARALLDVEAATR